MRLNMIGGRSNPAAFFKLFPLGILQGVDSSVKLKAEKKSILTSHKTAPGYFFKTIRTRYKMKIAQQTRDEIVRLRQSLTISHPYHPGFSLKNPQNLASEMSLKNASLGGILTQNGSPPVRNNISPFLFKIQVTALEK